MKHWKESIASLLLHQKNISGLVKELYLQIPGGTIPRDLNDEAALEKVADWDETATEMRTELTAEVKSIDAFIAHITDVKVRCSFLNRRFQLIKDS